MSKLPPILGESDEDKSAKSESMFNLNNAVSLKNPVLWVIIVITGSTRAGHGSGRKPAYVDFLWSGNKILRVRCLRRIGRVLKHHLQAAVVINHGQVRFGGKRDESIKGVRFNHVRTVLGYVRRLLADLLLHPVSANSIPVISFDL